MPGRCPSEIVTSSEYGKCDGARNEQLLRGVQRRSDFPSFFLVISGAAVDRERRELQRIPRPLLLKVLHGQLQSRTRAR
jgi:hypothetical protein